MSVGLEVLTAMVMNVAIFLHIALCSSYVTLKIEVICSSEMSVHIQITRCYIPQDGNIKMSELNTFQNPGSL
jgi:hypothetical protein